MTEHQPSTLGAAENPRGALVGKLSVRRIEALVGTACLAALYFFWMGGDLYRQDMLTFLCVYALIALGMYIPLVITGSLSISYNAYVAVGAYAVGLLALHTGASLLVAVPAAILVAVLVAIAIGVVSTGLTGFHLAVATLAVGEASDRLFIDAEPITHGSEGISNIPRMVLFGLEFDRTQLIGCGLVLVIVMAIAVNRLRDSVWGVALRLQREDPQAAEACGVPTELCRIVSLAIGASIAAVGGVLYALINQLVIPESFTLAIVFVVIFIPVIGGNRSAWGCIVGAGLILAVNELGSRLNVSGSLVFGLGVILVMLVAPTGLLGLIYGIGETIRWRYARRGPEK